MQIQYVILKVTLLSNKIPGKKIDFSWEVHNTEISQMDLLSTMRQCEKCTRLSWIKNLFFLTKIQCLLFVSQSLYYWICHWFSSQSDSVSHLVAEKPSIIFYVYWCLLDHNDQTAASRNEPENTISDVWVGVSWKRQYGLNVVLL